VILCRVLESVTATRKDPGLTGAKLLVCCEATPDGELLAELHVCADTLGAGRDDLVLVTIGSSARLTSETRNQPIDALVVGIIDRVEQAPA
jgi:microcompartment protein CcmK/EutM